MASEIKVDTISEKTSAGGVTIDGLLIKDGNISGDVALAGTTPTFTIGDAGAEDAALVFDGNAKDFYIALDDSADKLVIGEGSTVGTNSILTITDDSVTIGDAAAVDTKIVFDGNAQDYYIALDDSADDLLIGKGSTVGTTPAISIDSDLKVNIPVTTASTSASTGSLITGGGMGVGADLYVGDDAYLITDSAVLGFGADKDTTLTHTDGTGLTLNSTNKICFNDASQFIQGSSNAILALGATDEIDLTATAVDLNGTLDVSGTSQFNAAVTLAGTTPTLTIGDAGAEDTKIVFDGNAQDYYIGLDDTDDDLKIGVGSAVGTTMAIRIDEDQQVLLPAQCMFAVENSNTSNVLGATSSNYVPLWAGNEPQDRGSNFNQTNGTFTAPVDGMYMFSVSQTLSGVTSGHNTGAAYISTSNKTDNQAFASATAQTSTDVAVIGYNGTYIGFMDANDTCLMNVHVDGASATIDFGTADFFGGFLIG